MDVYAETNLSGQHGLYLENSNTFHIEDNDIYASSGNLATGIYINDCKGINEIYRNRFNNYLYSGIYAKGNNIKEDIGIVGNSEGLQIICNEFTNIPNDIYIAPESKIATNQGSERTAAGNMFYPECSGDYGEFYNRGSFQINYFAEHSPEYEPDCNYNVNIFKARHNTCPSKLNGDVNPIEITKLNDSINTVKTELLAITDGGDTEGTTEEVEGAEPDEALKLRNSLLEKSPNLSDTVMVSSVNTEDVLPAIMLKQVLTQNPQSAKSDKVQTALDNRQNPLPQYMRNEINLGRDTLSEKEKLEIKKSEFISKREKLINIRISKLLRDTLNPANAADTIENILVSENNLDKKYQLVNFYVSQNRIQDAQNVLSDIPQNFELSNSEQTDYEKNTQFYTIKFDLKNANKSWFEMTEEQQSVIETLAEDSLSSAGSKARAVMSLINGVDYGYPVPVFDENGNKNSNQTHEKLPETFNVFPEYAKDYFITEYVLNEKENVKDVKIAVFDNFGKEIKNFDVKTPANQFLTECENWKTGTYKVRKFVNGKITEEKKVIIGQANSQTANSEIKTSDINTTEFGENLKIYPNPAKDYFFVKYNIKNKQAGNTKLQISDGKGVVIKNIKIDNVFGQIKVSTSLLKKGIYSVSLICDKKIAETVKIVIE